MAATIFVHGEASGIDDAGEVPGCGSDSIGMVRPAYDGRGPRGAPVPPGRYRILVLALPLAAGDTLGKS
jgi:hypothetical protein